MQDVKETPQYLTVKQFCEKHPAFAIGGIRSAVFWKRDELEKAHAVAQIGRRVLINEPVFLAFVQAGGLRSVRGAA
jgi:CII-binding regulator of phage lambda lysogenization HflD